MIDRYYAEIGGWRLAVLFHDGRKWLKLLDASTLQVYRIAKDQQRCLVPYTGVKPRALARRLRQRRARLKRCQVSFSQKAAERALRTLEACPSGKRVFPNHPHHQSHRSKRYEPSSPTYAAAVAAGQHRAFNANASLLYGAGP